MAIDIQERVAQLDKALNEDQRMLFRVGVHIGEVVVDEEDQNIFGDGVNLAARIQAIAEPGGNRGVARRARRHRAQGRLCLRRCGKHQVKNVSRPVHVFHVRVVQDASVKTTTRLVPQVSLRFEGVNSTGQKFGFDVALDELIAALQGMTIGRAAGQCEMVVPHAPYRAAMRG